VISHDRWFLDRVATHILAYEDDSQAVFFEGNYTEYEADRKSAWAKPLPSRTVYGTRNWPDSGWLHEKRSLRAPFFCLVFSARCHTVANVGAACRDSGSVGA
jgi:hypothetical protein